MEKHVLLIILIVYLTGVTTLIGLIGDDIPINYNDDTQLSLCTDVDFSIDDGIHCGESTFLGNIIVTLSILPTWFNFIFFVFPAILIIILAILVIVHG